MDQEEEKENEEEGKQKKEKEEDDSDITCMCHYVHYMFKSRMGIKSIAPLTNGCTI